MKPEQPVLTGPLPEAAHLSARLDFYKPTMSQLATEQHPEAEVTFSFKNRGTQRLIEYVDPQLLQARLDDIAQRGFSSDDLDYLFALKDSAGRFIFDSAYIQMLETAKLPAVKVEVDEDIAIRTTGTWPLVSFWETVVMGEVNELYFEQYMRSHDLNPLDLYEEGDRRLSEKIRLLQEHPDIRIADFGTRRHFSLRWHRHVLERLQAECPHNLIGTSNVYYAAAMDMPPIGTFAHEMPMVYAGLSENDTDLRASHGHMLDDWHRRYGEPLSVALTDTFGSDFFFETFTGEQAERWRGVRHDSGDPFAFGERVIAMYQDYRIDPRSKTIVFSDGLDIHQIMALHQRFASRINTVFGWGTNLTNDLGIEPLSIVMKATAVNGNPTVKLSDNPEKHTGPIEEIVRYEQVFRSTATAAMKLTINVKEVCYGNAT